MSRQPIDTPHLEILKAYSSGSHTGADKEVSSLTHQRRAAQGLNKPDDAADLGSSSVGTLEAIAEVGSDLCRLFDLIGVVHHGDLFLGEVGINTNDQLVDGAFGVLESTLSREPPRGLGGEYDADELSETLVAWPILNVRKGVNSRLEWAKPIGWRKGCGRPTQWCCRSMLG